MYDWDKDNIEPIENLKSAVDMILNTDGYKPDTVIMYPILYKRMMEIINNDSN